MIKNIITPKDISNIKKKAQRGSVTGDEANILASAHYSEFQVQSGACNLFKSCGFGDNAIFLQIDNGGSAIEGVRKKKAATGTLSGFPDVEIKIWKTYIDKYSGFNCRSIYIEFKRISGKISPKQQYWHDFLKQKGESVYYCNNLVYYEKVILKEIRSFLCY